MERNKKKKKKKKGKRFSVLDPLFSSQSYLRGPRRDGSGFVLQDAKDWVRTK